MDRPARERSEPRRKIRVGTVRRRHVIHVEGYDPRGADGYYNLFRRACDGFRRKWSVSLALQPLEVDSEDFAHWLVDVRASNWQVATYYDFLRLERFIRSDMTGSMARYLPSSLGWIVGDHLSGAQIRIFCASPRFSLHLLYFQLLLLVWLALPAMIGLMVVHAIADYLGLPLTAGVVTSLLAATVSLLA